MMTEHQRDCLAGIIADTADLMGLKDWRILLDHDPCDDDSSAHCTPSYGRKVATLAFRANVLEWSPRYLMETIVHELLHCHHAHPQELQRTAYMDYLGQHAYDLLMQTWKLAHEYAIDAIALAWTDAFNLPTWPPPAAPRKPRKRAT